MKTWNELWSVYSTFTWNIPCLDYLKIYCAIPVSLRIHIQWELLTILGWLEKTREGHAIAWTEHEFGWSSLMASLDCFTTNLGLCINILYTFDVHSCSSSSCAAEIYRCTNVSSCLYFGNMNGHFARNYHSQTMARQDFQFRFFAQLHEQKLSSCFYPCLQSAL